jgi:D-alanine-D-alanine ligase
MKNKMKIAVLMGGKSSEYDVSIASGNEVVKQLDKKKYEVVPFRIPPSGRGLEKLLKIKPDLAYMVLHGPFGEDGVVQGMLELFEIPYTGPGVLASAIGLDKNMFRKIMIADGIPVPKYMTFERGDNQDVILSKLGNPPYFVKPSDQGSSIGASVVRRNSDLKPSLELAFKYSRVALVDEYINGIELTCAVIGNENPVPLPVIDIKALKGDFFDYKSKYSKGGAEEIVPAKISVELTKKVQELSVRVYKAIGCRGVSRVDFMLKNDFEPIVLEINTSPGLTSASLLPKAAKAAGISYSTLLDKIIGYAKENN